MEDAAKPLGYSLRELAAAGTGFAPGSMAPVRKVILGGRIFALDDRFVPAADFEALRAEYERLLAAQAAVPDGHAALP